MKTLKGFFAFSLSLALLLVLLPASVTASAHTPTISSMAAQDQTSALQRGYRTGYSDGYQAGWRDSQERATRDYRSKEDYTRADRAYVAAYGALEDYRDGYQQGFEAGYEAGYERRGFDSTVPERLAPRRGSNTDQGGRQDVASDGTAGTPDNVANKGSSGARGDVVDIPTNTMMRVELLTSLSTDASQRGDLLEARVLEPGEYQGATVTGRVTRVRRPGKVKGPAELQLSFHQIRLADGRWANFSAQIVEVDRTGDDRVGDVDPEGGVRGRDSTKDDVAKVGAGAGLGAIIGAIAGGGKGAAIGAAIGGAAGAGGVLTSRGKDIRLERGQQLQIRTATDTRIQ